MPAFATAYRTALINPDFRRQFGLNDWEEQLIQADPGFRAPSPTARMDTFFSPAGNSGEMGLYFTEYNAETPAAAAYNDALSEVFLGLPVMGAFEKRYEVRPLPGRHHVLHALLDAYRQWGGRDRPRIAILDWREVPTYSEFMLFADYFASLGLRMHHRRPAPDRVPPRPAAGRWHHANPADLQARPDQRTGGARRVEPPGDPGGAGWQRVHGQSLPLQAAP